MPFEKTAAQEQQNLERRIIGIYRKGSEVPEETQSREFNGIILNGAYALVSWHTTIHLSKQNTEHLSFITSPQDANKDLKDYFGMDSYGNQFLFDGLFYFADPSIDIALLRFGTKKDGYNSLLRLNEARIGESIEILSQGENKVLRRSGTLIGASSKQKVVFPDGKLLKWKRVLTTDVNGEMGDCGSAVVNAYGDLLGYVSYGGVDKNLDAKKRVMLGGPRAINIIYFLYKCLDSKEDKYCL